MGLDCGDCSRVGLWGTKGRSPAPVQYHTTFHYGEKLRHSNSNAVPVRLMANYLSRWEDNARGLESHPGRVSLLCVPATARIPHCDLTRHTYMGLSKGEMDPREHARAHEWVSVCLSWLLEETTQRTYPGDGGHGEPWGMSWNNCIPELASNSEAKDYKF